MVYMYMYVPIIMLGWEDLRKKKDQSTKTKKDKSRIAVFTMRAKIGFVVLGHSLERPALSWK